MTNPATFQPTTDSLALYDDFLAHTSIDRLQKILARFELFKMITNVPGDIVECGVHKGSGLYLFAKLQKLLMPNNERRIVGFDFFETNREMQFKKTEDQGVLNAHLGKWSSRETILGNLSSAGILNLELVAGNVIETTKTYAEANLGFRIALLYLDVDNYEGTLGILKNLFPRVVPGGLIVFDEYAIRGHGESDAVDEYFKGQNISIKSIPWANTPSGFMVKKVV